MLMTISIQSSDVQCMEPLLFQQLYSQYCVYILICMVLTPCMHACTFYSSTIKNLLREFNVVGGYLQGLLFKGLYIYGLQ